MINFRIIELLQQPKLITPKDLSLLETQIKQQPYIQNIRALYLYGVHLHQPQRYKEILTTTAAYTTDKKILYQFINQKSNQDVELSAPVIKEEIKVEDKKIVNEDNPISKAVDNDVITKESNQEVSNEIVEEPKFETNSKSNLEVTDNPKLDIKEEYVDQTIEETTEEYQSEVTEEPTIEIIREISAREDTDSDNKTVIEDHNILENKTDDKELSYDAIDDFLPQIKFSVPKNHSTFLNPPKFNKTKTQESLVPTVVSEISNEKTEDNSVDEDNSATVSFQESVDLDTFNKEKPIEEEVVILPDDSFQKTSIIKEESIIEESWQPMQVDNHIPDALIGKSSSEASTSKAVTLVEEVSGIIDNKTESGILTEESEINFEDNNTEESRPIINVSFFSDALSIISDNKAIDLDDSQNHTSKDIEDSQEVANSNVGTFINTWQSWLKIDRTEEIIKNKELKKDKAIEQFIENQPKISQLKDEVSFVVKEKKEDISHLMTETFANLYLEQKLYSKAIKAFETLIIKHPEKADYFLSRIEEVKDIRKPF